MTWAKLTTGYRKQDNSNQTNVGFGSKVLSFAHKSTAGGETLLDLTVLTLPTELSSNGFTNPSSSEILEAKLLFYKKNLILFRSVGGALIPFSAYQVVTGTSIRLSVATSVNEIIYGVVLGAQMGGVTAIDGRKIVATGVLAGGQTDINVGDEFKINMYPTTQLGEVELVVDGLTMMRNVGNATASVSGDGNYQEVDAGDGYGTVLRMNQTAVYDRAYVVKSTTMIARRPDGSRDSQLEKVSAALDQVIEDLAYVTGNPTTRYQVLPSQPQLTQFGALVLADDARLKAQADFVVGSSTQVSSGAATHSTIASAIAAASAGSVILLLKGTYTESVTVDKELCFMGQGRGSVVNGTMTFTSAADFCTFERFKVTGNVTFNSGSNGNFFRNIFLASGASVSDSGTANSILVIGE